MDKSSQEIATVNTKATYGKRKKITGTRKITYLATLVALSLAFKLVGQVFNFGSYKFTPVYIGWMLAAISMGPLGGAANAFITDLIGTLILQTGGFPQPMILLSNTLFGFIVGLAFKIPKIDARLRLLIGTAAALLTCTLGISTYTLAEFYMQPFWVQFVTRLTFQAPIVVLCAVIVGFLFPVMRKLGLMDS